MRVLQIGKFYPPHMGGIETHVQTLCEELLRSIGVEVVAANDGPRCFRSMVGGVKVARMAKLFTLASAPVCVGMTREIRSSDADIVHLHMPNPVGAMAYLASHHPGNLIVTWHNDVVRQRVLGKIFAPIEEVVLRRASAIIVTS